MLEALKYGAKRQVEWLSVSGMGMTDTGAIMLGKALAEKSVLPFALKKIAMDEQYCSDYRLNNEG